MKTIKISTYQHCNHAILRPSAGPQFTQPIRLLVDAACAARAGAGQMTLNDWRDVEREVKRRLEHEWSKTQR